MKLTHSDLIALGAKLNYKGLGDGLCAGFSGMWLQAVLAEDEQTFYERLDLISSYKQQFPELAEELKRAQSKKKQDLNLLDKELLDILGFFDGILLYQSPSQHHSHLPSSPRVNQDDLSTIFSVTKPLVLEKEQTKTLLNKNHSFSKASLICFFLDLKSILSQISYPAPMRLSSLNHAVCLKYNTAKLCWSFVDINVFQSFSSEDQYYHELTTTSLVDTVFTSFNTEEYAVFNILLVACHGDDKTKEELSALNFKYPFNPNQLHLDSKGFSVLHLACMGGHTNDVIELLKPQSKMDVNQNKTNTVTPIYLACQNGHTDIVKELLKHLHPIDINQQTISGVTPFYIACQEGHTDIVKELLKHLKPIDINSDNNNCNNGGTPFHIACQKGHTNIVIELLKPQYNIDINRAMNKGTTPLILACANGHVEIVQELLASQRQIDINKATDDGETALWFACKKGFTNIVKELVKPQYDAEVNKACYTMTPLHIACYLGHLEIIKALITTIRAEDINSVGFAGATPLIVACLSSETRGKDGLFIQLLQQGANITHQNNAHQTALDIAVVSSNKTAILELVTWACQKNYPINSIMSDEMLNNLINITVYNPYLTSLQRLMNSEQLTNLFFCKYRLHHPNTPRTQLGLFNQTLLNNNLTLRDILQLALTGNDEYKKICVELEWVTDNNGLNISSPTIISNAYQAIATQPGVK